MEDVVKQVLGFDIHVLTSQGKEKTIRFTDIVGHIGSSLSIEEDGDYDYYRDFGKKQIELKIDCLGYSMEFIER